MNYCTVTVWGRCWGPDCWLRSSSIELTEAHPKRKWLSNQVCTVQYSTVLYLGKCSQSLPIPHVQLDGKQLNQPLRSNLYPWEPYFVAVVWFHGRNCRCHANWNNVFPKRSSSLTELQNTLFWISYLCIYCPHNPPWIVLSLRSTDVTVIFFFLNWRGRENSFRFHVDDSPLPSSQNMWAPISLVNLTPPKLVFFAVGRNAVQGQRATL